MQDDLTRAQHYRELEKQMRESASQEPDEKRCKQLLDLANQYAALADKLVGKQADRGYS